MVARLDGSKRDPICRQVIVEVREFHEEIRQGCPEGRYPAERHSNQEEQNEGSGADEHRQTRARPRHWPLHGEFQGRFRQ